MWWLLGVVWVAVAWWFRTSYTDAGCSFLVSSLWRSHFIKDSARQRAQVEVSCWFTFCCPWGWLPEGCWNPDAGISEGDALATDISGAVVPSTDFPAGDSPACVKKSRTASRKKSESSMAKPRRSPRVTSQDFIKFWGNFFVFILLELIENLQGFKTFELFKSLIRKLSQTF
jgi:hypothetical protein